MKTTDLPVNEISRRHTHPPTADSSLTTDHWFANSLIR
jgi:hypothetical protein